MPDLEDEFERELAGAGIAAGAENLGSADDFDAEASGVGIALPEQAATEQPAPPAEPSWADYLLAGARGAAAGPARAGQALGNFAADLMGEGAPAGAERVGGGVLEQVPETAGTKLASGIGAAAVGIPAAIAAGPGIGAQAAVGAGLGAMSGAGEGEGWADTLLNAGKGAAVGGAVGGAGGALAKGLRSVSGALRGPAQFSGPGAPATVADEAMAALARAKPQGLAAQVMQPWETAKAVAGQAGVRALSNADKVAPVAAVGGQLSGRAASAWLADSPSPISWAAQSVLSSGSSGLDPQDEQRMTEAVLSGDKAKLAAADFAASMKSPAYEGKRREQLRSLQPKED